MRYGLDTAPDGPVTLGGMPPEPTPARIAAALSDARDEARYPVYRYPWPSLGGDLAARGETGFWLIGYGSLLSTASAKATIDPSASRRTPVRVYGGRRQFSYRIPQAFLASRYGVHDGQRYSALDCKATCDPRDRFNGILTWVPADDIGRLREREFAYDLRPLPAFAWDQPDAPARIGYVLDCPPTGGPDHPFATDVPPQPEYYRLCRDGAGEISPLFRDEFVATTYLGDGVTPVARWAEQAGLTAR